MEKDFLKQWYSENISEFDLQKPQSSYKTKLKIVL